MAQRPTDRLDVKSSIEDRWYTLGPSTMRFARVLVGAHDAHDVMSNAFLRVEHSTGGTASTTRGYPLVTTSSRYGIGRGYFDMTGDRPVAPENPAPSRSVATRRLGVEAIDNVHWK